MFDENFSSWLRDFVAHYIYLVRTMSYVKFDFSCCARAK